MAKPAKKVKTVDKWRKKKFFSVFAPKVFQERELGQSIAYESNSLLNRFLTLNLMVLTGNVKKQHINITFQVNSVKGDSAYTRVVGYEVSAAAIKRMVRRMKDRIDHSFKAVTKDKQVVRVKPMAITVNRTSRAVRSEVRKALHRHMYQAIAKTDYDSLINGIINEGFQKETRSNLTKIAPLKAVAVRSIKFLEEKKE
ncbi:hypothetical protein ACFL0V_01655 [Nanoarchaeota archaeon]